MMQEVSENFEVNVMNAHSGWGFADAHDANITFIKLSEIQVLEKLEWD